MTSSRRSFLLGAALGAAAHARAKSALLFIGSYTSDAVKGITSARFDSATGEISGMTLAAETPNPTFLELHPYGKWLYAVNEVNSFEGQKAGSISAFAIDRASGTLKLLNRVSTKGPGPCHVSLDKTGSMAMIANYGGGSVASYRILADGKLSEPVSFIQHQGKSIVERRQEGPHAHSINATPDNGFAVACDLGTDEIRTYSISSAYGTLNADKTVHLAPGSGPRHFAWHPRRGFGYSINELASTVTVFHYMGDGTLEEIQTISTLDEGFKGQNYTAEVRVHRSGRWLYGSNRGDDSIVVFSIDSSSGKLAKIDRTPTGGVMPRNIYIDPTGKWMLAANQRSNNIVVFAIDARTGKLQRTKHEVKVSAPVCLRILP